MQDKSLILTPISSTDNKSLCYSEIEELSKSKDMEYLLNNPNQTNMTEVWARIMEVIFKFGLSQELEVSVLGHNTNRMIIRIREINTEEESIYDGQG